MLKLLLVFLAGCQPALATVPVRPDPVADMIAHTVLLKKPGCTGVRIGGGLVLTAAHCTDEMAIGDAYSDYTLAYQSPDYDFSVLVGDKPIAPVWLLDARVGQHAYVVGYPGSVDDGKQYLTVTDGIYTGVTYDDMERYTAYAYYGNSGGGVWGDNGQLLGILVEMRPAIADGQYGVVPMPAHSYAVPIRFIRSLLTQQRAVAHVKVHRAQVLR